MPWEVMAPHEAQSQKNHGQSLSRIAERGGFGAGEAWLIVNDLPLFTKTGEWDWKDLKVKWHEFAQKINLHYDELEKIKARITELELENKQLHKLLEDSLWK